MNSNCFVFVEERDEFRMWQGLVGPYYTPAVDGLGNLSWTNNGNLVNPPTVNVSGRGLTITGIVDTSGDLPVTAPRYTCYLVGTTSPYHAYIFDGTSWTDLGIVGKGDKGDAGDDGFSPVVTVTTITGGHEVSIEDANGTQTFDVMDGQNGAPGQGVPSGGTTGQVLKKKSNTDYDTEWASAGGVDPATATPLMDGTAAVGSSTKYAREDHVHPSDTTKQDSITATGILKGAGSGSVSAAVAGTDYAAPDLGVNGATANQYVQITAVNANGKPTAFGPGTPSGGDVTADMLGIVINGNSTSVGASVGQYVIVKNSTITGITDGLYTAAQTIPANTAIDSTYLTAVSGGGFNNLQNDLQEYAKSSSTISLTLASGFSLASGWGTCRFFRRGNIGFIYASGLRSSSKITNDVAFTTIPYQAGYFLHSFYVRGSTTDIGRVISDGRSIRINGIPANTDIFFGFSFPLDI